MAYNILKKTIENITKEAPLEMKIYHPQKNNIEEINRSLTRAYIHLYLKSLFGKDDFIEREICITEGPHDGGIDAYFIDSINKLIYIIQSKFRHSEKNFQSKEITVEELFSMELDLILQGHTENKSGEKFNGKILKMAKKISELPNLSEYRYKVILLTNVNPEHKSKLSKLFGKYEIEIYDYTRVYKEVLLPMLTGTSYDTSNLKIIVNTSDKSSDSRMEYSIGGGSIKCKILVTFVPAMEIAKVLSLNKNSILKYNPRCYLDTIGSPINQEIYQTILYGQSHELALLNNGITILADFAKFNKDICQKDKASLDLTNPQIINGGQTAATILRILKERGAHAEEILSSKEVLLKIIYLINDSLSPHLKKELIKKISDASNKQNIITYADRRSNDEIQLQIQQVLFSEFGMLYERKRGEFYDGIKGGYISQENIVDRNFFARVVSSCIGELGKTKFKKVYKNEKDYKKVFNENNIEIFRKGLEILKEINDFIQKESTYFSSHIPAFLYVLYARSKEFPSEKISSLIKDVFSKKEEFEKYIIEKHRNSKYLKIKIKSEVIDGKTIEKIIFNREKYYLSPNIKFDLEDFFNLHVKGRVIFRSPR